MRLVSLSSNALVGNTITLSGDLIFITKTNNGSTPPVNLKERKPIDSFTTSSASRMTRYLRECSADYKTMITLTYPRDGGMDGKRCKDDLHRFCQEIRRSEYWQENDSMFWFLEFQKRGAVHFHLFTTISFIPYQWIAKLWTDIVYYIKSNVQFQGSGSDTCVLSKDMREPPLELGVGQLEQQYWLKCDDDYQRERAVHEATGTRIERIKGGRSGVISYAHKYARKQQQKVVPDEFGWCGRFWGISGSRERDKVAKVSVSQVVPVVAIDLVDMVDKALSGLDVVFSDVYVLVLKVPTVSMIYWFKERITALSDLLAMVADSS